MRGCAGGSLGFNFLLSVSFSLQKTSCLWVQPAFVHSHWHPVKESRVKIAVTGVLHEQGGGAYAFGTEYWIPYNMTSHYSITSLHSISEAYQRRYLTSRTTGLHSQPSEPFNVSTLVSMMTTMMTSGVATSELLELKNAIWHLALIGAHSELRQFAHWLCDQRLLHEHHVPARTVSSLILANGRRTPWKSSRRLNAMLDPDARDALHNMPQLGLSESAHVKTKAATEHLSYYYRSATEQTNT